MLSKKLELNIDFPIWFIILVFYTFKEFVYIFILRKYNIDDEILGLKTFLNNPITYTSIKQVFNTSFNLIWYNILNVCIVVNCIHIYIIMQEIMKKVKQFAKVKYMVIMNFKIKQLTISYTINEK